MDRTDTRSSLTLAAIAAILLLTAVSAAADLNEAGRAAYLRGDYAGAERLFREGVAAAPRDPVVRHHLAIALLRLGRFAEAREVWQQTLTLDPPPDVARAVHQGLRALPWTGARRASPADDADAPSSTPPAAGRRQTRPTPPPADPDGIVVPIAPSGSGGWVAQVTINGTHRGRFLVDTGAATCVIGENFARELRVAAEPGTREVALQTLGGPTKGMPIVLESVALGEAESRDVRAVILPVADLDGILGNTFLGRYRLTLDTEHQRVVLHPR